MNLPACIRRIVATCLLAAAAPSLPAAPLAVATYEIVQLARADPPANPLRAVRDHAYAGCVEQARALNLPVLPFPALPSSREERITTITNGASSIVKRRFIDVKFVLPLDPKGGCRVELADAPVTVTVITHGALVTTVRSDSADVTTAPREHEVPEEFDMRQMDASAAEYPEPKTVNGVALRCLPAASRQLRSNPFSNVRDRCVYAQAHALYLDLMPMVLYSHVQLALNTPDYAYHYIVEPLSVRRLAQEEPDPFLAALRASGAAPR